MHAIFEQEGEAQTVKRGGENQVAVVQGEAAFSPRRARRLPGPST